MRPKHERKALAKKLSALCDQMDQLIELDDKNAYYSTNLEFHWCFIAALGNAEIEKSYREIIQKLHLARFKNLKSVEHRRKSNEEHKLIARALLDSDSPKDLQKCAALQSEHVSRALGRLREK
jgi:DNA-binding GntR family transcriptional regulator